MQITCGCVSCVEFGTCSTLAVVARQFITANSIRPGLEKHGRAKQLDDPDFTNTDFLEEMRQAGLHWT